MYFYQVEVVIKYNASWYSGKLKSNKAKAFNDYQHTAFIALNNRVCAFIEKLLCRVLRLNFSHTLIRLVYNNHYISRLKFEEQEQM